MVWFQYLLFSPGTISVNYEKSAQNQPIGSRNSTDQVKDDFSISERKPVRDGFIPRLFIREPGWKAALKLGSERMFCFVMNPGEEHYHRIADGEIHLHRADERICIPCADRLGLLHYEPRTLRNSIQGIDLRKSEEDENPYQLREEGTPISD